MSGNDTLNLAAMFTISWRRSLYLSVSGLRFLSSSWNASGITSAAAVISALCVTCGQLRWRDIWKNGVLK